MKSLSQTYEIKAPSNVVWQALVDPQLIDDWGAGPAQMSENLTKFSLWGGDIYGRNLKIVKNKTLVQEWFGGDWAEPSHVVINLTPHSTGTTLTLEQTNIPDDAYEGIESGWQNYYFSPLKSLVESQNSDSKM